MVVRGAGLGRAKSWPATRGDLERRRKCVTRIGLDSRRVVRMYTCAQGAQQECVFAHTRTRGPTQGPHAWLFCSCKLRWPTMPCCASARGHGQLEPWRQPR